jgi:hypothetical protein
MKRVRLILLGAGLLTLAGLCGYETQVLLRQREQLAALRLQAAQPDADLARLRRENTVAARELAQAEKQLAQLPVRRPGATELPPDRELELTQWLARVKHLRRLFDEKPDQRIPEMRFLTDQDWLRIARDADLESDEGRRTALGAIRSQATAHFMAQLLTALRAFTATRDTPSDISALASLLKPPVNADLLSRYALSVKDKKNMRGNFEWTVENKDPIDFDYDIHHHARVGSDGNFSTGSGPGVYGWTPDLSDRIQRAYEAFTQANHRAPTGEFDDLFPYFNPPLDLATVEKLGKAEAKRRK